MSVDPSSHSKERNSHLDLVVYAYMIMMPDVNPITVESVMVEHRSNLKNFGYSQPVGIDFCFVSSRT